MGTATRLAAAAALVALAGCSAANGGPGDQDPSPSTSASEPALLEFVSERDLEGLVTDEDMPEDLEVFVYESIWTLPSYAQTQYDDGWMGVTDPEVCAELGAATVLVQRSDLDGTSSDTINFMFDIGGTGLAESDPSIMFVARVFDGADEAAAFLNEVQRAGEACEGGFDTAYSDGTSWTVEAVSVTTNRGGYPEGTGYLALEKFNVGFEVPYAQLFAQYENVIISAVDVSSETSAWVTGRDLQRFLRLAVERLAGGA